MALEFSGHVFNHTIINLYTQAEAAINCLGNMAILANDENVVVSLIEQAKIPLQQVVESTMVMDPEILPDKLPAVETEVTNIFDSWIELNQDDGIMRAVCSIMGDEMDFISDWVEYNPDVDCRPSVAECYRNLAEVIERRARVENNENAEPDIDNPIN